MKINKDLIKLYVRVFFREFKKSLKVSSYQDVTVLLNCSVIMATLLLAILLFLLMCKTVILWIF